MKTTKGFYGLIIFSLVLLFNPNINVFDLLPDFIAWFILAKLFERAADSAPFFEEAREDFVRLGWLNLVKIPALLLVFFIRSKNAGDNDVFALTSFVFAVIEALLTLRAVKNLFTALFYVGERTEAAALISPFKCPIRKGEVMTPESLRGFTYFFVICKSIFYTLPDMFLLTRTSDTTGQILTISGYYPYVLIFSQLLGIWLGTVWLMRTLKYARAVRDEGKLFDALSAIASNDTSVKLSSKAKIRSLSLAITLIGVSAVFMLDLVFDNFDRIDILPNFIFGIFLTLSLFLLKNGSRIRVMALLCGVAYSAVSIASYNVGASFLSKYDYTDLITDEAAKRAYSSVIALAVAELVLLIAFLVICAVSLNAFIRRNTGITEIEGKEITPDKEYYTLLYRKSYIFSGLGILAGAARLVNVILTGHVDFLYTDITDITRPTIAASPAPWFNVVVTATAILFIGYALYYASTLKDEVRMKYECE